MRVYTRGREYSSERYSRPDNQIVKGIRYVWLDDITVYINQQESYGAFQNVLLCFVSMTCPTLNSADLIQPWSANLRQIIFWTSFCTKCLVGDFQLRMVHGDMLRTHTGLSSVGTATLILILAENCIIIHCYSNCWHKLPCCQVSHCNQEVMWLDACSYRHRLPPNICVQGFSGLCSIYG